MQKATLANYLADFLAVSLYQDYAPNGLQIEGRSEIKKIVTAVSASLEVIQAAIKINADALLVHHGYFWQGEDKTILGIKKARIAALLKEDINLFAFHLPLDCHKELGNNAKLAKILQVSKPKSQTVNQIPNLLWSGSLPKPQSFSQFTNYLEKKFANNVLAVAGSASTIKTIAWCTGAAQNLLANAASLKVDAYISGEISERTYYEAREYNIHYFACGHHATERYGIRALGEHLAAKFALEHQYIEVNNPF
ncbi:MAG: Nif3-like dinuclear metal center hexameric protein [Legionellales bacterium RIFCSPHIGHO2_12_FULL_37_14]|nr:MAG: Nif3-like dinuclear metal center hexameric protein [Legionellales bacterium RIFCSPHIGHO2_12_FULL_37_14]